MKISHNWLQTFFKDKLPSAKELSELLTTYAFEIDGIEEREGDNVLDVKVLPDRACYALSHRGVAYEVSAITGLPIARTEWSKIKVDESVRKQEVVIEAEDCNRSVARIIEGVKIEDSPKWLQKNLEIMDQRAINSVVDATNFVMFDIGHPLHAFDADKIKGKIIIRMAKEGESLNILGGKEIKLTPEAMVITDEEGILDIAGIKGGEKSVVDENTKNILLVSSNFDAEAIRRSASITGVRTDSSKRYENGVTANLSLEAMEELSSVISDLFQGQVKVGEITDEYPRKEESRALEVSISAANASLGTELERDEIVENLEKLNLKIGGEGDMLKIDIPDYRLDLQIPEDVYEEIGRMHGFDLIQPVIPKNDGELRINKEFYWENRIKNILREEGFSEIISGSFVEDKDNGDMELENPQASDKGILRKDLEFKVADALDRNSKNAPLYGLNEVKLFEIGKGFSNGSETKYLCIANSAKKSDFSDVLGKLSREIEEEFKGKENSHLVSVNLSEIIEKLPEPKEWDIDISLDKDIKYKKISPYPFVLRDIAVFVPSNIKENIVLNMITLKGGDMLVKTRLFDVFEKDDKVSYAFNLVFQSDEKTLTDDEINEVMDEVTAFLNSKEGWQVR